MAIDEIMGVREWFVHVRAMAARNTPYLPSFRRIAAKIIEPATGASTWALGSQRWVKNNGIFTIKAMIVISHHIEINCDDWVGEFQRRMYIDECLLQEFIHSKLISKGREAVIVYNIRYIPACNRSG